MGALTNKIDSLVSQGSLLYITKPDVYFHPIRAIVPREGKLIWINAFPESQHDSHELLYDRADIWHNRDIVFRKNEWIVAQLSPFDEWGGVTNLDEYRDEHLRWQSEYKGEFKEHMDEFIETELKVMAMEEA